MSAQEEFNFKVKTETGILMGLVSEQQQNVHGGVFLRVEPKLNTSKNTIIGLRFGVAINEQNIDTHDPLQFYRYNDPNYENKNRKNDVLSLMPTFDYYFMGRKNSPYLGGGLGYYFLTNNTAKVFEVSVKNQVGFLLRGGLYVRKFILGLEYNFIPKADVAIPNEQTIGTIAYSYFGMSIGYTIRVRKIRRKTKRSSEGASTNGSILHAKRKVLFSDFLIDESLTLLPD